LKRPAFQFYPADWRKDPALSSCSLSARGLWIELMCIAHESEQYGHLSINGIPMSIPQLARLVGESPAVVVKLLTELDGAGVFSRTDSGCIFSRRMVKDERIRNARAEAGRLGGNPNLLNQKDNQIDNHDAKQASKRKLTPSSSSSSSSSKSNTTPPPDGVDETVWQDFLKLRKAKKAPVTETAIDGIRREADKAGMTLADALAMCCKRGWQGFDADWVKDKSGPNQFAGAI